MNFQLSKWLLAICTIILVSSCDTENDVSLEKEKTSFKIINRRIAFQNASDAASTLIELSKESEEGLIQWEKNNNFQSLRSTIDYHSKSIDTILLYFPNALATLLNSEKEYQIGDTIIWFNKNDVFKIPSEDNGLLSSIKRNPESPEFNSLKTNFVVPRSYRAQSNGRILPFCLSTTTLFNLAGTLNYRFMRDLRPVWTGTNYATELTNCLTYQDDTNGNWYLAGESVSFKKIVRLWVTPEMVNYTLGPESVQSSNNNGYLKLNIAYSPTPFAGVITARFIHEVYTPASGWRIFDETVTWY